MADGDSRSGVGRAAEPHEPATGHGGKKLDPTPPPDHQDFVEARAPGLAAIRSKLASRRKQR
jgi:hypothetical protein